MSPNEFYMADDEKKRNHSKKLSLLLYLPHVLPRACKHKIIRRYIFHPEASNGRRAWNFHADITLDGIQPALDAVLDYYKVRTTCLINVVLALIPIHSNLIYFLN